MNGRKKPLILGAPPLAFRGAEGEVFVLLSLDAFKDLLGYLDAADQEAVRAAMLEQALEGPDLAALSPEREASDANPEERRQNILFERLWRALESRSGAIEACSPESLSLRTDDLARMPDKKEPGLGS